MVWDRAFWRWAQDGKNDLLETFCKKALCKLMLFSVYLKWTVFAELELAYSLAPSDVINPLGSVIFNWLTSWLTLTAPDVPFTEPWPVDPWRFLWNGYEKKKKKKKKNP